jgi:glycosyltransferase involved in cell wall biosynthesis
VIQQELLVEGWRGISHSYCLVNQFQLLALQEQSAVRLSFTDKPFVIQQWSRERNHAGLRAQHQAAIDHIPGPVQPHARYRIYGPVNFQSELKGPALTFVVTELGRSFRVEESGSLQAYVDAGGKIHTPSRWSAARLTEAGVPEAALCVIPHGAHPDYFYPLSTDDCIQLRRNLGFQDDDVILVNVGTPTFTKGFDLLIKAFVDARRINPRLKLLIKDQRGTYFQQAQNVVGQHLKELNATDEETLGSIKVIGVQLSLTLLNQVYNAADCYVTPYRAEGFNLPALEALSAGTPLIATRGGATDDFLSDNDTIFLPGKFQIDHQLRPNERDSIYIEPDLDALIQAMVECRRKEPNLMSTASSIAPVRRPNWHDAAQAILCQLGVSRPIQA